MSTNPKRYVSTYTDQNGARVWTVVGPGGTQEIAVTTDREIAVARFLQFDDWIPAGPYTDRKARKREIVPVWHGDESMFRNLGDLENPKEPDRPLAFGLVRADQLLEPFCACGRVISQCDGSRSGCGKGAR